MSMVVPSLCVSAELTPAEVARHATAIRDGGLAARGCTAAPGPGWHARRVRTLAEVCRCYRREWRAMRARWAAAPPARPARRGVPRSKYLGVAWSRKSGMWRVRITYEMVSYHVGDFVDEVEAARAYDRRAGELFGERARVNFPVEVTA